MTSSLRFDAEEVKNRSCSKVITLLKDMLKQLEKEVIGDEEVYDKNECWLARGWHIGGGDPERRFSACRVPSPASRRHTRTDATKTIDLALTRLIVMPPWSST